MYTIIHTFTGQIYTGSTITLELSGFSSIGAAVDAAENRCLDMGGSYVVVMRDPS